MVVATGEKGLTLHNAPAWRTMPDASPLADLLPSRRGGSPSSETESAGRPAGVACLGGTRRGPVPSARALAAAALLALAGALALPAMADAQAPTPAANVAPAEASEGEYVTFSVTLTEPYTSRPRLNWTASISSDDTAIRADLGPGHLLEGSVRWREGGPTAGTFTVPTLEDTVLEDDETFTVTLEAVEGVQLGESPTAKGTIVNDDVADTTAPSLTGVITHADGRIIDLVFDAPYEDPVVVGPVGQTPVQPADPVPEAYADAFSLSINGVAVNTEPPYGRRRRPYSQVRLRLVGRKDWPPDEGFVRYWQGQALVLSYDASKASIGDRSGNQVASFTTGSGGVPAITNNSTVIPGTTATLKALRVGSYTNPVATVTPPFAPHTTSYATFVDYTTTRVPIAAGRDAWSRIEFLDADDNTIEDVISTWYGAAASVILAVGENVIKVRVTAEDGVATRTYTLTVTREGLVNARAPAGTAGLLEMNWTEPTGSAYEVQYWPADEDGRTFQTRWTTDTRVLIWPLAADTEYKLRVRARSAAGWGDWSAVTTARTGAAQSGRPVVSLHLLDSSGSAITEGAITEGGSVRYRIKATSIRNYHDWEGPGLLGKVRVDAGVVGDRHHPPPELAGRVTCWDEPLLRKGLSDTQPSFTQTSATTGYWDFETKPLTTPSGYAEYGPLTLSIQRQRCGELGGPPPRAPDIGAPSSACVTIADDGSGPAYDYADSDTLQEMLTEKPTYSCSDVRSTRPLKGRFVSPPAQHDGQKAVEVQVAFSDSVYESEENVGGHGVRVDGGRVTSSKRVGRQPAGSAQAHSATRSATRTGGAAGGHEYLWEFGIEPDSDGDVTVALDAGRGCDAPGAICTSDGRALSPGISTTVEGPGSGPAPLTASFEDMPETHDGESAFRFRVAFSEDIGISYRSLREDAFTVTGGRVTRGARVDDRRDLFEMTVEPDSDGDVTIELPAGRDCATSGAICTKGEPRRQLTNGPSATVAGPWDERTTNTAATGAPTIGGTPRVGEELTASTSGISDADGLDDASFAHQWMRADSDIRGATGSTYTAVEADEGDRLKVRVSFTDDAGNQESLTSAVTDAVAARSAPLTASFEGMPAEHRGEGGFHFRIAFSEDIGISFRALREDALAVTGGRVTGGKRVDDRRDLFRMTVRPDSDGDVTITLPAGRECGVSGAICTKSEPRRQLTNRPSATVTGPVGISVADARVEEGDGAVLAFAVTLSRAAGGTVAVDYATANGSAHAGVDYRAASGKLKFRAGESSKTVEVTVFDDSHDEGEETLTLRLSNASSGRVTDGEATGTIENTDPLPRALLARFGRTAAVQVVEQVEARLEASREPGFRGRVAGRELRRGMERDIALGLIRRLGGAAGVGRGVGASGSMAGASGAAGFPPPGPSGRRRSAPALPMRAAGSLGAAPTGGAAAGAMGMAPSTSAASSRGAAPSMGMAGPRGMSPSMGGASGQMGMAAGMGGAPGSMGGPMGMAGPTGGAAGPMGMSSMGGASGQMGMAGPMGGAVGPMGMSSMGGAAGSMGMAGSMGGASGQMGMAADGRDGWLNGRGFLEMGLGGGDVLTGSAFALNRESGGGGVVSLWSRGARSRFSGREGALSLGGDVRTTMFGADYIKGPLVVGLSLSNTRGVGEYSGPGSGRMLSSVTGLYPWLGYRATDRITVWGVTGYGVGGMLLTPGGGPALESGLSTAMAAAGARGELVGRGGGNGFALAFKADALWAGTGIDGVDGPEGRLVATSAAVTRVRTGLEGSRGFTLGGALSLRPSVEVGLRHDGGDAETGAGVDVGGGLVASHASSGLAVDVRVRTLLVHEAEGFREHGVSLSLSWNPTPSTPLGLTARLAPSWGGQATGGADALWGRDTMAGLGTPGGLASGNRLDAELGYGLPVGRRFVGTPRFGVGATEHGRDYRLGYGLGVLNRGGLTFELGVDAQRRESPLANGTSNGVVGRATVGW